MPFSINRTPSGKYKVVGRPGHVFGTHDSRSEAERQLRALYANVPDARKTAWATDYLTEKTATTRWKREWPTLSIPSRNRLIVNSMAPAHASAASPELPTTQQMHPSPYMLPAGLYRATDTEVLGQNIPPGSRLGKPIAYGAGSLVHANANNPNEVVKFTTPTFAGGLDEVKNPPPYGLPAANIREFSDGNNQWVSYTQPKAEPVLSSAGILHRIDKLRDAGYTVMDSGAYPAARHLDPAEAGNTGHDALRRDAHRLEEVGRTTNLPSSTLTDSNDIRPISRHDAVQTRGVRYIGDSVKRRQWGLVDGKYVLLDTGTATPPGKPVPEVALRF